MTEIRLNIAALSKKPVQLVYSRYRILHFQSCVTQLLDSIFLKESQYIDIYNLKSKYFSKISFHLKIKFLK